MPALSYCMVSRTEFLNPQGQPSLVLPVNTSFSEATSGKSIFSLTAAFQQSDDRR